MGLGRSTPWRGRGSRGTATAGTAEGAEGRPRSRSRGRSLTDEVKLLRSCSTPPWPGGTQSGDGRSPRTGDTIDAWSADTFQSDEVDRARAAMRRMVLRLGELAVTGVRDPREVAGSLVDALLAERVEARPPGVSATPTGSATPWSPWGRGA